jgi:hypothetical protein
MRQIKYKLIGATRFYERKEIKDALAYLRVLHNPADIVSLERIINEPPRSIGAKTVAALRQWAAEIGVNPREALQILHHGPQRVALQLGRTLSPAAYKAPPLRRPRPKRADRVRRTARSWTTTNAAAATPASPTCSTQCWQSRATSPRCATAPTRARIASPTCRSCAASPLSTRRVCPPWSRSRAAQPFPGGSQPGERQRPARRERRRGDAAHAAHGQGAGISRGLYCRHGGGHSAAQPQPGKWRPGGHGRGAPPGLCRRDARQAPALPGALLPPQPVGRQCVQQPSRFLDDIPPICSRAWSTASAGARAATSASPAGTRTARAGRVVARPAATGRAARKPRRRQLRRPPNRPPKLRRLPARPTGRQVRALKHKNRRSQPRPAARSSSIAAIACNMPALASALSSRARRRAMATNR